MKPAWLKAIHATGIHGCSQAGCQRCAEMICGKRTWPHNESNVCHRRSGHDGDHEDFIGRRFDNTGYLEITGERT